MTLRTLTLAGLASLAVVTVAAPAVAAPNLSVDAVAVKQEQRYLAVVRTDLARGKGRAALDPLERAETTLLNKAEYDSGFYGAAEAMRSGEIGKLASAQRALRSGDTAAAAADLTV